MLHVILESSDGQKFEVDVEVAKKFGPIQSKLEWNQEDELVIPLNDIHSSILHRIINWITYHKDDEKEAASECKNLTDFPLSKWDSEFLNVNPKTLLEILLAADYLGINDLKSKACQAFSDMVEDKTFHNASLLFRKIKAKFNGWTSTIDS